MFPFLDRAGQPTGYHRVKPSTLRQERGGRGKPVKYESPRGQPNQLYVPPGTRPALSDPAAELVIAEGEKKALAADCRGFPTVGLVGVNGWQAKRDRGAGGKAVGPRKLIPDLAAVPWVGRRVVIVSDSDAATNENVVKAQRALADTLAAARAEVRIAVLPAGPGWAKVGLDDYLLTHTADDLRTLLAAAVKPPSREKAPPAEEVLTEIGERFNLFCSPEGEGYAADGRIAHKVRSRGFERLRGFHYYRQTGKSLAADALRPGGRVEGLLNFLNLDAAQFTLVLAWLSSVLRGHGPFPVLVLTGEQGSAKTTAARVLKRLVDQTAGEDSAEPKEVRNLMVQTRRRWVMAFDNLSRVPDWLSDALCRLSTGAGFGTRALNTDDDEITFFAERPVILTGIDDLVTRGDLQERSLLIRLPPIPENSRRTEQEFWEAFAAERPQFSGRSWTIWPGG